METDKTCSGGLGVTTFGTLVVVNKPEESSGETMSHCGAFSFIILPQYEIEEKKIKHKLGNQKLTSIIIFFRLSLKARSKESGT